MRCWFRTSINSFVVGVIAFLSVSTSFSQNSQHQGIVIREEPFGNSEILTTLSSLEDVSVNEEIPYYLHVTLKDGTRGFIRKEDITDSVPFTDFSNISTGMLVNDEAIETFLEKAKEEGSTGTSFNSSTSTALSSEIIVVKPVQPSSLPIRLEPRADSPIIRFLQKDQALPLLGEENTFYKIRIDEKTQGFILRDQTKLDSFPASEYVATLDGFTRISNELSGVSETPEFVKPLLRARQFKADGKTLEIHFLDVGQGDGNLIVCPNGKTIMIDAGTTSGESPDAVRAYVSNIISSYSHEIDYLVVTHPDADHYNMLDDVLHGIPIGMAFYVGQPNHYKVAGMYNWIKRTPKKSKRMYSGYFDKSTTPNKQIDCGEANIYILAAAIKSAQSVKNAMSIVVMLEYGSFKAIMTGDATFATEKKIMERYPKNWLASTLLKVGHHGSLATSTNKHWAETVKPEIIVASAGYFNSYGHPRKKVIDKLTPYTVSMQPHGFRWAQRRSKSTQGTAKPRRKYIFQNIANEKEGIYNTAVNGHIVVVTNGVDYEVLLDQGED